MVQVCTCYPEQTAGFAQEVMDLLDRHYAVLNSALRQSLVKSLILLRNRGHLKSAEVLPLFFRLFRCQDKGLRDLLFKHIVAGTCPLSKAQTASNLVAVYTTWLLKLDRTWTSRHHLHMPAAVIVCLHQQYVRAAVDQVAAVQVAHTATAAAAAGSAASPFHCAQHGRRRHACWDFPNLM